MTLQAILDAGVNREWLTKELYRRAAFHFEKADEMLEAAECWALGGEHERAAEIYLEADDGFRAAPSLFAAGRFEEALACYRESLNVIPENKLPGRISALLGVSACLRMVQDNPRKAREMYQQARKLIEAAQPDLISARCWKALGEYGIMMNRYDLIHIGFEKALAAFSAKHNEERLKTAKRYLKSVRENRLLAVDIQKRIAEWTPEAEEEYSPTVKLRKEPLTISDDDILETCGLRWVEPSESGLSFRTRRPVEYLKNVFEDNGETVFDRTTGIMWHKKGSENRMKYESAGEYVNRLNQEKFSGYSDWRLPTVDELSSLLEPDKGFHELYCDSVFEQKSGFDWYWTADTRAGGGAWDVYFSVGFVDWNFLNLDEYVRVCRP